MIISTIVHKKKCLYFEKCKSRSESENKRREELLNQFSCKVKELYGEHKISCKEYYKLLESKSDLYAQKFLNNLKRGFVYTGFKDKMNILMTGMMIIMMYTLKSVRTQ